MNMFEPHILSNLKHRVICSDLARWDEACEWCEDHLGNLNQKVLLYRSACGIRIQDGVGMTTRTLDYHNYSDRDAALRVYFPYRLNLTKTASTYHEEADWVIDRYGPSAFLSFHRVHTDRRWLVDDGKIYFKDENDAFEYRMRWSGL